MGEPRGSGERVGGASDWAWVKGWECPTCRSRSSPRRGRVTWPTKRWPLRRGGRSGCTPTPQGRRPWPPSPALRSDDGLQRRRGRCPVTAPGRWLEGSSRGLAGVRSDRLPPTCPLCAFACRLELMPLARSRRSANSANNRAIGLRARNCDGRRQEVVAEHVALSDSLSEKTAPQREQGGGALPTSADSRFQSAMPVHHASLSPSRDSAGAGRRRRRVGDFPRERRACHPGSVSGKRLEPGRQSQMRSELARLTFRRTGRRRITIFALDRLVLAGVGPGKGQ